MFCLDRCHFARVPVKEASVAPPSSPGAGRRWFAATEASLTPSPERGQNDNDRGKTREFKQRDGKASYLPRRRRARRNLKDMAQIP